MREITPDLSNKVAALTAAALRVPDRVEIPTEHHFAEGIYTRKIFIPRGTLIVGKVHLRETTNICALGDITILTADGIRRFRAGEVIVSAPGIQKVGYAHEDTIWINVHATNERDLEKIEAKFVRDPDIDFDASQFMLDIQRGLLE